MYLLQKMLGPLDSYRIFNSMSTVYIIRELISKKPNERVYRHSFLHKCVLGVPGNPIKSKVDWYYRPGKPKFESHSHWTVVLRANRGIYLRNRDE